MGLTLITAPANTPISLAEVKNRARVDGGEDDALLGVLIKAAVKVGEQLTNRAFITQRWELSLDAAPSKREIALPWSPLQSLVSFKYFADDDVETAYDTTNLLVVTKGTPGRLVLKTGSVWPTNLRPADAIRIQFDAGFGADSTFVPDLIKEGLHKLVSTWYENREDLASVQSMSRIPEDARTLLRNYEVINV